MKLLTTYLGFMAALVVSVTAVPIAQAGNPTPAELRALEIRGQALNHLCEDSTLTGDAYRALCGKAGAGNRPTPSQLRALEIRGQAMNHLCDSSKIVSAEASESLCGGRKSVTAGQTVRVVSSSGFDWGDFGIGAGAMLGFVLLAGGIVAGVHYGRRSSVHPRTAS